MGRLVEYGEYHFVEQAFLIKELLAQVFLKFAQLVLLYGSAPVCCRKVGLLREGCVHEVVCLQE